MGLEDILRLCRERPSPLVIAIDGRSAAGKTTLARKLSQELEAPVVHMDHFFLPFSARTPQRLAEPGGNFDRERFLSEVYAPLSRGEEFCYGVFDCAVGEIGTQRHIPRADVTIVEGAYCLHPELQPLYGLRIFCDVSPQEQLRRLALRESAQALEAFKTRWISMEERYLAEFGIREICGLVVGDR